MVTPIIFLYTLSWEGGSKSFLVNFRLKLKKNIASKSEIRVYQKLFYE